ncbi:MAG TPA: endonuclease/exonuclease/phosphatase family protein [Polyangiaceae bacterium]|nr:endonuclease/exonuclease/phosphatase family protein [Polyangiaceae bacterium]
MSTLRIATLNIWNKAGPWIERLALIRREVERLQPAVLGLQEVLRFAPNGRERFEPNSATCQASEIGEGFDYHVAYAEASDYGGGLMFGNALLSRFPIVSAQSFILPGLESGESRSLLYTVLETPFGKLPVFVTHLNWKFHQGSVRLKQVRFIAERVAQFVPTRGGFLPPVLMGDFNAEPESDEIRFLRGLAVIEGQSVFFADAWVYGGDGSLGATYDRSNDYARAAREPSRRIDYIFVRGPDSALRGEPMHTELAFATPDVGASGQVWPSDHFGLVSDVYFAPRSP